MFENTRSQRARNWQRRKAQRMGLQPRDNVTGARRFERDVVPCPAGYGSWNEYEAAMAPKPEKA